MGETAAQRRRRRTRAEVTATAVRLFDENGYAQTTTAQVAEAANLSRATLFRYFPDKEDLLFGLEDDLLAEAESTLRTAAATQPPWAALRGASIVLADRVTELRELLIARERVLKHSPALRTRAAGKHRRWEETLANVVRDVYGLDSSDAALLAKLTVACFEAAEQRWLNSTSAFSELLHQTFDRVPQLLHSDSHKAKSS